ncbi:MAG TPA: hypothetical protein VL326_05190 [Kofleriaceae bacterium]|nr:hypothetical protein [Kofleriaceae bacterium]
MRRALPWLILAVGWVLLVLYAYPGVMTMDSFDQLREGREWIFTDAHPPIMAGIWGVIDRIWPGPFGMLVLQATCFLAGIYLVLQRAMRPWRAAVCAVCILLFPPVLAPMAVIWKDCVMAGFLVLGIPAVLAERRWVRIVGLGLFMLATALRYNALGATLPLIVLLFEWKPGQKWFVRYGIATATWLAVVVVAMGLNGVMTDKQLHYWHSSSALADITGVLAKIDKDIPDSELGPLLVPTEIKVKANFHAAIRAKYRPADFQQIISGEGNLWDVPLTEPMPVTQRDAIQHAWTTLVTEHVGAYTRYRFETFGQTLGLHRKFLGATVITHRVQYPGMLEYMHIPRVSWGFQERAEDMTMWTAKRTRLFRPHLYLALTILLLGFAFRQRDIFAVMLSGLAMELTLIPLGWTADFRFSHWLVTCTVLAIVMLIARRARAALE